MNWKGIAIHYSASRYGSVELIRKWHLARGFNDIGYHFVVLNGYLKPGLYLPSLLGEIQVGRDLAKRGAHTVGFNDTHIGICIIGDTHIAKVLASTLKETINELATMYPVTEVKGHNELTHDTKCPNIDMDIFRNEIGWSK